MEASNAEQSTAFSNDPDQHFDSLEQMRNWADALWKIIMDGVIVAYYRDDVRRGDWPQFI